MLSRLLLLSAIVGTTSLAYADTVTDVVNIKTGAASAPLSLSYTLSFDPSQSYTNATQGISLLSASGIPTSYANTFAAPLAFDYYSQTGTLIIGGALNGADLLKIGTDDYFLTVLNFERTPIFGFLSAGNSVTNGLLLDIGGSVNVSSAAAVTPEPSSFALLGTGLLGVAGTLRKRYAQA